MRPKKLKETPDMFRSRLDQLLDPKHPLVKMANEIDWTIFENEFENTYHDTMGRPGKSIRLMVALNYLKYTFDLIDEAVLQGFLENPYWQYFAGFEYFQHQLPTDPSNMTRFRDRVGDKGIELMLHALLKTAQDMKVLTAHDLHKVNVDTTVQEKAIAFPTDARLYYKARERLVRLASERDIKLRQSYVRLAREALIKQSRYAHAKQFRRSARETRKLKTYLGRVYRDISRKATEFDPELRHYLYLTDRILKQEKHSKDKIYSLHAPEVECISKGKAHKRYEFGVKVGMATTSKGNWVVGIQAFTGNPYDGHTLTKTLEQMERLTGKPAREVFVDKGYRGHGYTGETEIHIVGTRKMKKKTRTFRNWLKRRNAIEPIFGHLKSDNRMSRNALKGTEGDQINALLSGCGFNMRKLLAVFLLPDFVILQLREFIKILQVKRLEYGYSFV